MGDVTCLTVAYHETLSCVSLAYRKPLDFPFKDRVVPTQTRAKLRKTITFAAIALMRLDGCPTVGISHWWWCCRSAAVQIQIAIHQSNYSARGCQSIGP
jgi:hypothetical protein